MLLAALAAPGSSTNAVLLVPATMLALGDLMHGCCCMHTRIPTACFSSSSRRSGCTTSNSISPKVVAVAAAAGSGGRRRRKAATPSVELEQHQPLQPSPMQLTQQQPQQQHLQLQPQQQPRPESGKARYKRHNPEMKQLLTNAAELGLRRASELEAAGHGSPSQAAAAAAAAGGGAEQDDAPEDYPASITHRSSSSSSGISSSQDCLALQDGDVTDPESSTACSSFLQRSAEEEEVAAAVSRLTRFLGFRERSAAEVTAKLEALGYPRSLAQRVLAALQQAGLQSDARFADMYARGAWRTKAASPGRLAYELRARGVAAQHISAALTAVFGSDQQRLPAEPLSEQEEGAWAHLVEACRQRAQLSEGQPQGKRRQRLANWLQRRGHSMSTVFKMFEAVGI